MQRQLTKRHKRVLSFWIEAKNLLDKSQAKLDSAQKETKKIIDQAKKNSENLIIEMKPGEISKPLIKSNSVMIFKLLDKRKISFNDINLEKMKSQIISQKKNELLN